MRLRTQTEEKATARVPAAAVATPVEARAASPSATARRSAAIVNALHAGITVLPLAAILALVGEALRLKAKLGLWPLPANHPGLEHVGLILGLFTAITMTVPLWLALTVALWGRLPRRIARCAVYLSLLAATVLLFRLDLGGLTGWLE